MKIPREEINAAIDEMIEEGLVEDSGARREGEVVWTITEKGRRYQALQKMLEYLDTTGDQN